MSPCFSPAPASTARFNTKRSLRRRVDDRPAVLRADGYGNQLIHKKEYSTCQIALTRQSIQSQHVTLFTCTICQVGQHVQHYIFHCPFRIWALGALSQHRHDTRATRKTTLRRGLLLRESIIPKLVAELFTILSEGSYYLLQPCHLCRIDHCAFGCEHHGT